MQELIRKILASDELQHLIGEREKAYYLSQIDNAFLFDNNDEEVLRILFLLINAIFTADLSDEEERALLDKSYKLLKTVNIKREESRNVFMSIMGIDGIHPEVLYFFYLAIISLKSDKTISIRIDLRNFSSPSCDNDNWKFRLINKSLTAFILLVRKSNGFQDISNALHIIEELRREQNDFEGSYLKQFAYRDEVIQAYQLLGIYHLSKAIVETAIYLTDGYKYKERLDAVIRQHIDASLKLFVSEPRMESQINLVDYGLKTLYKNSIWNRTKFNDKIQALCRKKAECGAIELLPSQRDALSQNLLDVASNVTVLQMPTSAGKTLLAEFNILVTKSLRPDAKIVYVVPSRALVNQIYFDLKSDLEPLNFVIEKTSSAIEIDPTENAFLTSDAEIDILVSTPEKLDLLIRRSHPAVDDVSVFIIDEAHTIQNGERGARLELLLAILRRERPNAKFMLLSPFIKNARETLTEWLGGGNSISIDWKPAEKLLVGLNYRKTKKVDEIQYSILPSPYSALGQPQSGNFKNPYTLISTTPKDQILEISTKHFAEQGKTSLILCWGKKTAEKRAEFIYNNVASNSINSDEVNLVRKFIDDEIGRPTLLTKVLEKGIATHHSGLSDETKLLVEHLIREKLINYVCATTTIAEGVNFPVSSVFFDDYRKGSNGNLSSNDFWNIAGRAGRTLVDNFGKIILPFHNKKSEANAQAIISKSANELVSVLAELFVNADAIQNTLETEDSGLFQLLNQYPESISPLIQYSVHLISVGDNHYYVSQVEDLFKDSLGYYLLDTPEKKNKFINVCKSIYLSLQERYGSNAGVLSFSDKTGFSVPSVLKVMRESSQNDDIKDLDAWTANRIFDRQNPSNLTEKVKVIAALKETQLGTDSNKAPFNPELLAKIIIAWVKGDKLSTIATEHPTFSNKKDDNEKINEFVKYMNSVRFKASWGLSALEGIVRGNHEEMKDSHIPSFVYYGVDNEKSLALRMLGMPRQLSSSFTQIIEKDVNTYSLSSIRKMINELTNSDWDSLKPRTSALTGMEWKRITEILVK
jgi:superfamily II DNA/RNA helicase